MKKKILSLALLAVLLVGIFAGCAAKPATTPAPQVTSIPAAPVELNVFAAASLTESLTAIAEKYKQIAPNVKLTFNFAASGTLQTQIEQGATADLFISAAKKQMDTLESKSLIVSESKINLLVNKVVLIVPASSTKGIASFNDCLTDKVKMIAIGDPTSVPAGQYAKEVFTYLKGWDAISAKANLGTDVKQVLSWVASGDADCGIVYGTDAGTNNKVKVVAEAPAGSHSPIVYPAAILKSSAKTDAAKAFLKYLQSEDSGKIFTDFGFSISK